MQMSAHEGRLLVDPREGAPRVFIVFYALVPHTVNGNILCCRACGQPNSWVLRTVHSAYTRKL